MGPERPAAVGNLRGKVLRDRSLSRLGVTSTRYFKITTAVLGGGEASADLKILAVDTSPGPAAQTMTFD